MISSKLFQQQNKEHNQNSPIKETSPAENIASQETATECKQQALGSDKQLQRSAPLREKKGREIWGDRTLKWKCVQ